MISAEGADMISAASPQDSTASRPGSYRIFMQYIPVRTSGRYWENRQGTALVWCHEVLPPLHRNLLGFTSW